MKDGRKMGKEREEYIVQDNIQEGKGRNWSEEGRLTGKTREETTDEGNFLR